MLYNKRTLQKVEDKKIMRKVKSQWVVVSLASFGLLAGVTTVQRVSADTTATTTTQPAATTSQTSGTSSSSSATASTSASTSASVSASTSTSLSVSTSASESASTSVSASAAGKSGSNAANVGTSTSNSGTSAASAGTANTTSNSGSAASNSATSADNTDADTTNVTTSNLLGANAAVNLGASEVADSSSSTSESETPAEQAAAQQGMEDAFQGKANASSSQLGQAVDYYNAAYSGAQAAVTAYNSATKGQGTGTQDYTFYGNTASKKNDDGTTHTTTNTTDGTPQAYGSSDDVNQGGADNPEDASNSATKYENTLNNKLVSQNNVSVQTTTSNSTTNSISIPTSQTASIVSARVNYQSDTNLSASFDAGVAYAFGQLGQEDAESGKWQGVVSGTNGTTKDQYLASAKNDTNNPYDQAYRGALAAMNAYFDGSNNYKGNTAVSASSTGNTYYDQGYNDVVSQAKSGIAYVQNGNQFSAVLTGNASIGGGGNVASGINTIRLANDVDFTNVSDNENDESVNANGGTFTIDGQNHMMDYHGMDYTIKSMKDLYVQNFQTLYGTNFYGPYRADTGLAIHYGNLNYVGSELLSAKQNDAYFFGNVNVITPDNSSATYASPFQSSAYIEDGGNQENLEVNNFILQSGAHYFGTTSPVYGGNSIIVQGNFTVDTGAKMTIVPRGYTNDEGYQDGSSFGIMLMTSGASLNIKKDATVNIIPGHYEGNSNILAGGVFAYGNTNINIDGGSLNYEGENGASGEYNEPIDLYNSNNSINVFNGGLLQVMLDSIPTANNTTAYWGVVANPNNGSFNVGSKGSLKIGVTHSDSNASVPYLGPININSVGGTHVIMIKPNAAKSFQTTSGSNDSATTGSITAYTVAITQSNGQKQYLYYFNLPSGSTTYTGTDLNGTSVTGQISGNTLDIADVPAVQVVGPLTKTSNSDGTTTVTGFVKLTNYAELNNSPLYVGVATGANGVTYSSVPTFDQLSNKVTGENLTDAYSSADPYKYTTSVSTQGYTGGLLKVSYKIPAGMATDTDYVGMRFHYGINSVSAVLTPSNYSTTVEGFKPDSSNPGKVTQDSSGDMVVANGSTTVGQNGIQDGITDAENNNSAKKSGEPFDTQTNDDYVDGYTSAQAGYKAYSNQTANQDYTQTDAYKNSSNPTAFTQGYNAAAYDTGLHDARLSQTNSTDPNYKQAQTEYNTVYAATLAAPTKSLADIAATISPNTSTSSPTPAETQAFTDAQGVAAFVKDEQAGNISGTTSGPNFNALTTNDQKVAYEAALTGYNQAMTVSPTSDDPDGNATKAEIAGFEYGQSLINGGLSTGTAAPTAAASHMNNVTAAQIGYNTANQAVTAAKGNGSSSTEAQTSNAQSLPADSGTTDATFDRFVKYGAYAALKGNSDTGLNQYEEVGYSKVITASAYQDGLNAYKNKQSATPTGTDAESNAGQTSFAQGYSDGQKAAAVGIQNFKSGTAQPTGTDTISYITSQAQASAQQGFADGDAGKSAPSTDTSYNASYTAGYNAGQSTKLATDDAKNGTNQSKSANDSAAYTDAKNAYADGASAYKTGNTKTSTSADPVYQAAYNRALTDTTNARAQAIQDADDNHGQAKSSGTSYSANQDVESVAEKAYTDAQNAYSEAISGVATPTNPNDAQTSGAAAGANDKTYIDATVANQTTTATVSSTKSGIVTAQIGAAQAAFTANPDALDTLNSTDPLANYAYKAEMDSLKAQYAKGITDASTGKNPDSTASDAEKKGASDYAAGLTAAINGQTITNATSGNKEGEAAADSYNAGYNDAKAGTPNDSNSGDPVKKSAYEGTSEAFTDVANGTTRSTDSMDPVQKVAYEQALKEAQADAAQGAQEFVNGKDSPNASTVSGAAEAEGYKQAQSGYSDGQSGKSSQSDDPNYTTGYNAGKSETSGYNDQTAPTNASKAEQDAYDGAKAGAADGIAGNTKADNSAKSKAYQDAYNNAYADAQTGYPAGYAAGQGGGTPAEPNNPSYMAGYHAGQAAKQALTDAQNGVKNPSSVTDQTTYNDVQSGYHDGVMAVSQSGANASTSTTNGDVPYKTSYSQGVQDAQKARLAAITDAENDHGQANGQSHNYSSNSDVQSVAEKAYSDAQSAYSEAVSGTATPTNPNDAQTSGAAAGTNDKNYVDATVANPSQTSVTISTDAKSTVVSNEITAAKADFAKNPDALDTLNSTDPLANYAYKAEMDALHSQYAKGINDATTGKSPDPTASDAEKKGASDYAAGLNAAVNGPAITNPTTGNKDGAAAADTYTQGYNDAKNGTADDSNSGNPVKTSAYNGAKAAFEDVTNGTTRNTDSMDPVQKVAYEQALKEAQADAAQGAQDFVNGKSSQYASTVTGKAQAAGYNDAQSGYQAGQSKETPSAAEAADPNYMAGYNAGKSETSGYNDQSLPANATPTEQEAYDGAKAGAADGIADNTPADNSAKSKAYQDAYNKAYQDAQTGYPAGYKAGQGGGTPAEPNNPSYMAGYHAGQAAKQATTDAYNGVNNPSGVTDQTTYKDVQDGYHDGVIATGKTLNNTPDATTGDAPYKTAYHQGIVDTNAARAKAMQAADDNYGQTNSAGTTYSANQDVESVAERAYTDAQSAYNATMSNSGSGIPTSPNDAQQSGISAAQADQQYVQATVANPSQTSTTILAPKTTAVNNGITKAQADFKANPDTGDSLSGSDALTTYAYKVEMDSLKNQYANGIAVAKTGNSPATTASDAEKQGAIDYTNGLNAAVNSQNSQALTNPNSGQKAGEEALNSFNAGYQDALNGKDDSSSKDPVQKAAQAAATEAFDDVQGNTVKKPDEIKAMNPVAQVAYQKALTEAQADAKNGAQAYLNGGSLPDSSTVEGKTAAAGYNAAKSGYTAGKNGDGESSTDPSYTTGYNAGKSETSGYDDKNAPSTSASQSEQDAYNGAQAGSKDAIAGNAKNQNTGKSPAYQDGYNQGYDDATGGYTAGYNAGQNGTQPNATQTANPSYMKGYNAGQAAKQAIADDQNGQTNASGVTDQTTYDDAQKGYHDGVIATGKTGVNTPNATAANGDQPYQAGYDQAIKDTNAARAVAYQDADDNHGQAIDSNKKYSPNSDIQAVAQQAYNDAQTAYSQAITGATTPTSPNDAQASGAATGANDKKFVDATVANQSPTTTVSSAKSDIVTAQISAAQAAFKQNPDASDSLNGTDPLANYAYKAEMDSLQTKYNTGKQEAAAGTSPATTASDAEKQGAIDYTNGLNAAVNGQTIANPTSGNKAGEAAIDSFNKGYQDAKNGTDDSTITDSVQKAAQAAATAAFNDVKNNNVQTADQIKAMNPVAQVAYQKALTEAQADAAKGAQAYVNGGSRPDDSTVDGKAAAAGYDKAKAGYTDGQSGTAANSTDPSYTTGYNTGKSETSGYNDQNLPDNASQTEKDAYNAAKAGAADGIAGKQPADNSTQSQAYKDAYTKAYQDATNGYKDGYAAGQNGTKPDASQVADPSYMKGYNAGQAAKQAIADDQKGQNNASSSADLTTYNDAQQGYHDGVVATGKTGVNTPNATAANGDAPYQAAYDQAIKDTNAARALAYQDADDNHGQARSASSTYSPNKDVESVAEQAYTDAQTAYAEAITGATTPTSPNDAQASGVAAGTNDKSYVDATVANQAPSATVSSAKSTIVSAQITAAQAAFKQNPDASDNLNGTDPLANYAYKAEMDDLQKQYQAGIADGKAATNPVSTASDAEKQGASDFTTGLNAAVNGSAITNPNSGNQAGEAALKSFTAGYTDAENGKDDSGSTDPVQKAAQAAATEAFNDVKNNSIKQATEIAAMNPVAQVAYQKALTAAENAASQGAQTYVNGGSRPDDTTVTGKVAAAGYDDAKSGYADGKSGASAASTDNPSYTTGYNAGKSEKSGYSDQSLPADASQAEKDAYNAAKAGAADGIAGKQPADNSTQSQAYKDAYTKAYQDATNGYNDGYAAGQNGTKPTGDDVNNPSYVKGYNAGQAAKQAIADDQNGQNNASSSADLTTYNDVQNGYHDGVVAVGKTGAGTSTTAPSGDAPYQKGYTQGVQDALAARVKSIQDADDNHGQAKGSGTTYSANKDVESVAEQAYTDAQTAYSEAVSGATTPTSPNDAQASGIAAGTNDKKFVDATVASQTPSATVSTAKSTVVSTQITAAQAAFKQNPDASDSLNGTDPLANYAYKAEMDSLQTKYNTGKQEAAAGTSPATTASDAEKQGAIDYTAGLNAAVNGQTIANPTSGNKAGEAAIDSFNAGYQDAKNGTDDSGSTDSVQKAAQAAATAAFNDVKNNTVKTPDEIKTMNPVAQVAYQKAEQEAQADAAKGAQAYVNGGARPDDSTVDGKAAAAGYDAAKAGYTDGKSGTAATSTDPSYTTGYKAGQSETAGYNDQSLPANASQAEQDAYNGAKAGATDGTTSATKPSDLSTKSQAYQDAYNKAYADAQAGAKAGYQDGSKSGTPTDISGQDDIYKKAYAAGQATAANEAQAGAKDYVAGKSAPTTDTPASHYGYNQAQAGFNDAAAGKSTQLTDPSYTTGYNAEKSAQEAISDDQNGNTSQEQSASDPTAYTDAQQGYHDGVIATGKTGVNTPNATAANGDEPYQVAYDQAIKDTNAARALAYQDADNDHGQANGSGYKYSANSDVQGVAQQAYTDAQTAYSEAISGATTPTSPNDAQASGISTAKNDQSYVDDTVAGKTPGATVSAAKSTVVSTQITAAQKAFAANPDASDSLNGTDPLANYAYKTEMDALQTKYKAGIQDAAAGTSPATTASDAEKQGASDYTNGLNAAVNGKRIANPTSGNQAGEAAVNSFNKGYQDAVDGKDDSASTDPVQKAAQAAATAAFNDVKNNTVKTPDEIKAMNPVAQVAYQKAEQEAQADAAKGAQAYVNGGSRPDDSTVDGKAAAAGYDAAKSGYTDGQSGKASTSTDPSYTTGYNAGKSETSGYDDQKAPATDATQAEKDAYNAAKAGASDGIAGKQPADNSNQSQAYKDAYTKAYQDATTGYNAGYAAGQNGTKPSAAQAADPSYMKGYNAGQAAKQAITDDQNGQNNASSAADPATYNDAQQGYHDGVIATGKTFNNTPNATTGDAPYQMAYDQAIKDTNAARAVAYQDADDNHGQAVDSSKKYSANSDIQTVAEQAYTDAQTAYSEAISGTTTPTNPNDAQASGAATGTNDKKYVDATVANQTPSTTVSTAKSTVVSAQITAAQRAFAANPDASDSLNGTDPLANYAYKTEMDVLQTKYKAGIQDAATGTSPAATASDAEKKGASDYTNGLNAAVSGQTITTPTSGNKAGEAAADSFNKGYQDAKNGTDDSSSTDPVQKAAQTAAAEAFKDVTNGTVKTPDEINTMDPVAKVAYQKAEQEAEADAAQGAQTYVNGGSRPDDSTVAGKAAAAGYDAAKAGYSDGQNGKTTASTDPNYTTGYNAGKGETSGYSDQTTPATNAPQAEQDAYAGAKAGAAAGTTSATKPSDLATKPQAYQDAYNKAYADAQAGAKAGYQDGSQSGTPTDLSGKDDIYKNAYNAGKATATDEAESGAKDYVAGKSAPTADTPAGHYGYNQAKAAFADANAGKASQSTDPSYTIGYDASKSEQQAASGSEKGSTNQGQTASDPAAYTDAAKAYASAVTAAQAGNTATTTVTDPVYKQAYDQGLNDAEAARQAAIRDANANHGLSVDPAKVYSGNSAIQLFARRVYAEVQRTYAAVLAGTTPSSPDSTQQQGVATANNDKAYVDATVAGTTPSTAVSDTKAKDVAAEITAAQQAFAANPDASDNLNGTDPLANYAYKVAMDDLQAKYKAGIAAASNVNEPGSSADAATQRGANDFNAGLNATLNGQTITNPTSGEQAGEAEATAFNQGYADAQNGVDDSNAKDPVQKAAQKAATQAFTDSPDFKTDAEVNQMDPVSKAAYLKAEAEAKSEAANGAKNFVNGQTTPNNGTAAGKAAAAGYADAQKGYNDAKANVQPTAAEQADANYMKGYQAYKDSQTGYNNAGTLTKPADDAPQPERDAYNGAIAGVADAVAGKAKESDLATKSQAYQDAYNKAYAAAQSGLNDADSEKSAQSTDPDYMTGYNAGKKHITTVDNTGQSDALSGRAPQDADLDAKDKAAYDEAYSRTIAGLNDGGNGVPEAMPNDPNYQKGYAAGEAARALLADKQNNTHTTVADQASYDLADQAYEQARDDVANGRPKSPKSQSPVYVLVYDRAYDFLLNEKNQKKTPQPEPAEPVKSTPVTPVQAPAPVLPQTDEQQRNTTENSSFAGLLLASIFGLFATAKRKRDDK